MSDKPLSEKVPGYCKDMGMMAPTDSPIIHIASRGISPVILLIGLYVFFMAITALAEVSREGVLMAVAILLLRLTLGTSLSQVVMPTSITLRLSAVGALIFAGTGVVAMFFGGNFLDYHYLPFSWLDPAYLRYYGILLIEVGVILTVTTTLVAIYDDLLGC